MEELTCTKCGSNNLVKEDGLYVCQHCGTKYKPDKKDPLFSFSFTISESDETKSENSIGNIFKGIAFYIIGFCANFIQEGVKLFKKLFLVALVIYLAFLIYVNFFKGKIDLKTACLDPIKAAQLTVPSDDLQRFFLDLNLDSTKEDVQRLADHYKMKLGIMETVEEDNSQNKRLVYSIGNTLDSIVFHTYKRRGDYIDIRFGGKNMDRLMWMTYHKEGAWYHNTSVLLYNFGKCYSEDLFRDDDSKNEEQRGYYYTNLNLYLDHKIKQGLIKCDDGKEALLLLLAFKYPDKQ